ncbi:restriction endonuclease subunit S [Streptococcus suis]|uniref:restriction endonuclease subunit S n=1 Tax=Streptococcus suis TaxID=1307 RepID=UPI0029C4D703|nr:restriction endonuclease subunit S [Streptococcus suis]MDX4991941.1 restriction endonuclease subunit S [Streptococcus suis]
MRRFSELAEIRRGLTYSPTSIRKEGIRVLRSSNIDEDTFTFGEDDVFVDKGVVKIPLVKEGDILITAANGSSRLVGKHTIIKGLPANSTVHGGFMLLASCRNPEFVNSLMSSEWYNKFISLYVAGGNGAIGNLNKNDLDNQLVVVPSTSEQSAIGTFFSTLDQQITLHQRKLDKLKNVKQAYLSEMFPAEGERVPKRRFPGFTDAWELRKLGELGTLKNGMNFSKDAMGIGFPFINLQNIFGKNIVDVSQLGLAKASSIQLKNYNLQKGDVLFVRSSVKLEGVGEAAIVPKNLENTTYSGFIIRYRDSFGLDYNFKRFIFGTSNIRNQIMSQATDSANKNISQQVLTELDILVPPLLEQNAIGTFFSILDQQITLHQRKS